MHPLSSFGALLLVAPVLLAPAQRAGAQEIAAQGVTSESNSVNGWATLSLGGSKVAGNRDAVLAAALRGTASYNRAILEIRVTDAGPFLQSGNGVSEAAALAGFRTMGRRLFATAALGYGSVVPYHQCGIDGCARSDTGPRSGTLAYDFGLHANLVFAGVGAGLWGTVGPSGYAYTAVGLSAELGWFGR